MQKVGEFKKGDYVQINPEIQNKYMMNGLIIGKKRSKLAGQYFTVSKKYYIGDWRNRQVRYNLEGLGNMPFGKNMLIKSDREENEL